MEKLIFYKETIKTALAEIAAMIPPEGDVITETIFDDERGHYLLFCLGWANDRREYASILHIDVKANGKVYVQHDGTDLEFALRLAEKGIAKSDMVVAYRSPRQRVHFEGFALS